jgi:hypothetical protein
MLLLFLCECLGWEYREKLILKVTGVLFEGRGRQFMEELILYITVIFVWFCRGNIEIN